MTKKKLDPNDPRRTIRLDAVRALSPIFRTRNDDAPASRADTGIFFQLELEAVIAQAYELRLPELKMASGAVLPIRSTVPRGATSWAYFMYEPIGMAKFLTAASWRDIPRADVQGTKTTGTVEPFAVGYGYTLDEIEQAQYAGKPLQAWKANSARRAFDLLVQDVGLVGDQERNLQGFTNHPNMTILDAPAAAAGGNDPDWAVGDKTGAEMIADLNEMIDTMLNITADVERPDMVAMSRAYYRLAQTTYIGTDLDRSVLTVFREANPEIREIMVLPELDTASAAGGHAVMMWKQDPESLWLEIPISFEQHGPMQDGLEFGVATRGSTGGVICVYPLTMIRMDFD